MSDANITETVGAFLTERVRPLPETGVLTVDEPLLSTGRVDSLGVLELIAFLEERYDIRFEAHEVDREHLNSIRAIEKTVRSKLRRR